MRCAKCGKKIDGTIIVERRKFYHIECYKKLNEGRWDIEEEKCL
jgi:hypothetical protein